jgi:glycine dehydrogenase
MTMLHRVQGRRAADAQTFLVSKACYPQTIAVLQSRAEPLGLRVELVDAADATFGAQHFGLLLQYPDEAGSVEDLRAVIDRAHAAGLLVAVATDLLALTLLVPPGEMGADVVVGNSQRFGVPLGFGGTARRVLRHARGVRAAGAGPGHRRVGGRERAPGVPDGAADARAAHPPREGDLEHLHGAGAAREHGGDVRGLSRAGGPEGDRRPRPHAGAHRRARADRAGLPPAERALLRHAPHRYRTRGAREPRGGPRAGARGGLNFRYRGGVEIGIALDETCDSDDVRAIVHVLAEAAGEPEPSLDYEALERELARVPCGTGADERRTSTHPVFNTYHSEMEMMRYIRALESRDIGLETSMIPLGSCTMKLNAAAEMLPITWPEFSRLHPFVPVEQAAGYARIVDELEAALCEITGFAAVSLQPNSGAQGELAGLLVIRAWHRSRGDDARTSCSSRRRRTAPTRRARSWPA